MSIILIKSIKELIEEKKREELSKLSKRNDKKESFSNFLGPKMEKSLFEDGYVFFFNLKGFLLDKIKSML